MGIPTGVASLSTSALWHRAYNLIWNEWFRDENLQDSVSVLTNDGPDPSTTYTLLRRNKKADYFTTALPWPQKGSSVALPLGASAAIKSTGSTLQMRTGTDGLNNVFTGATGTVGTVPIGNPLFSTSSNVNFGAAGTTVAALSADLSTATASTINQLRLAFQIQKLLERNARGGTRYSEILQSHFGVVFQMLGYSVPSTWAALLAASTLIK